MSSSSATATGSRSPSPATPELSDSTDPVAIRNEDAGLSYWYHPALQPGKSLEETAWEGDLSRFPGLGKGPEEPMLHLEDLLEQNAYDDSPNSQFSPLLAYPSPLSASPDSPAVAPATRMEPPYPGTNIFVHSKTPISGTKPIPPPASRPRKRDPSAASQTVFPPKESCYNLPIITPNIPEGGTKSRVETQVRVTVDLAHASPSPIEPFKYDKVGTWKWLQLPKGTATKKRTRKEGKIDPAPEDILHLTANVTCASAPHNRVLSCSSCQTREAKRVARKLAARVRPARSDSDSPDDPNSHSGKSKQEDTTSIIQFNCAEVLEFSTGSVVLPLRITCYCRHHREKVGFNVHFTMMDHTGRIVGTGTTRPIMITDDHKSTSSNKAGAGFGLTNGMDLDWHQMAPVGDVSETRAPSKRRHVDDAPDSGAVAKKRIKPYDASQRTSTKTSRETSVTDFPSPCTSQAALSTRSPSPSHTHNSHFTSPGGDNAGSFLQEQASSSVAPSDTLHTGSDSTHGFNGSESYLSNPVDLALTSLVNPPPDDKASPVALPGSQEQLPSMNALSAMPYLFFHPNPPTMPALPAPKIHRLIPNTGPTVGGIEVTVLGANFHPTMQLNCVFGEAVASSTQRWSDNTLLCVLPPRATPGIVAVWFDGVEKEADGSPPCLFNYTDESDRALMELALQVVGLKMTGKIEDAKNVAMRIMGTSGGDDPMGGQDTNMMQLAPSLTTAAVYRDLRPLLLVRAGDHQNLESLVVNSLAILDTPIDDVSTRSTSTPAALAHSTPSGQTLLHLASFLGFNTLTRFLIEHGIDLDARDRNGYTALHFAALSKSADCAKLLVRAGADMEIVNALGRTPEEQAPPGFFADMFTDSEESLGDADGDDESCWGDAEGDDEDDEVVIKRHLRRRGSRHQGSSPSSAVDDEKARLSAEGSVSSAPLALDGKSKHVDAKQAASIVDMIQWTLGQLHAPQALLTNMPQLPIPQLPLPNLPNMPHLPGMPTVPWALPQLPMVFPVNTPAWPSFLGEKRGEKNAIAGDKTDVVDPAEAGPDALSAVQEWRAIWEKWIALAMATTRQAVDDVPPPVYTPRATTEEKVTPPHVEEESPAESSQDAMRTQERASGRRLEYDTVAVTNSEVESYEYQPTQKRAKTLKKKHDRMLILFWIPILLISLLWGFFLGLQSLFHALRTALPLRSLIRG
ncbi:hypothetical protein PLICRDRAFT_134625 [Plicaturopsis crispa FD-325 SS-3]|nr:hypothetical protein PLICRDRAFT_134625 [Plicaturopsis crispa FD-325 SS-3]